MKSAVEASPKATQMLGYSDKAFSSRTGFSAEVLLGFFHIVTATQEHMRDGFWCVVDVLLISAYNRMHRSAGDGAPDIQTHDLAEAIQYRPRRQI